MTSPERALSWVALGESETQEFKQSTGQRTDAVRTLCAMLNGRGGRVLLGVSPDERRSPAQRFVGQQVTDKTLEDLTAAIREIEPPVFPRVDRLPVTDDREVIVVTVSSGQQKPYRVRGVAYRRLGNSTLQMSSHEADRLLMERLHATERWETQVATGFGVEDLDQRQLVITVEEAIRRGRSEDPGTRDPLELLRGLGLLSRDGRLLNAALALFGREDRTQPDFPQFKLRVARFRGVTKDEFLDNRQFVSHAFDLLQRAERFLVESLPKAGRVVPEVFARIDDPLYPPVALREALANALCHRDYAVVGGSVGVAIFDDRLEISSSGDLHFGLTPEDLYRPHESQPWNPTMANVFYRRGVIESWGRGTLKIAEQLHRAGLVKPEFEVIAGAVVVRFRPLGYVAPSRVQHDLTNVQRAVLAELGTLGQMSFGQLAANLVDQTTPRALKDDLSHLKRLGLVELQGRGRGARWRVQ